MSSSCDGLGNRVSRSLTRPDGKTEATEYLNDLSNPLVQVLQATGDKEVLTYLYGLQRISVTSERPGKQNPKADTDYYLYDGLGSVKALVDSQGNQVARYSYDEWGVPESGSNFKGSGHPNPYGFTGEDRDPDTELLYLRARYYEPDLGRFDTRDPFPGYLTFPTSANGYPYVMSNPTTHTDPSGEQTGAELAMSPPVLLLVVATAITVWLVVTPQGREVSRQMGSAIEEFFAWARETLPRDTHQLTREAEAFLISVREAQGLGSPLPPRPPTGLWRRIVLGTLLAVRLFQRLVAPPEVRKKIES